MADAIEEALWPIHTLRHYQKVDAAANDFLWSHLHLARWQLLKARAPLRAALRVIRSHSKVDRETREQAAGALALLDKLEKSSPERSKSRGGGRPLDDDMHEMLLDIYDVVNEVFEERRAALKIGTAESSGIGVIAAVLHAFTGRRVTNDALYKRIRRGHLTRTK